MTESLKNRALNLLRELRESDGSGCCYSIKTIAEKLGCEEKDLFCPDWHTGPLEELDRDGDISFTAGHECVMASGGRMEWGN